jgi:hypothetical protein
VAVKITNRSGQRLHLGAERDWLTFNVESADGFEVIKTAEVPVAGEFDLESSELATKRVDLAPSFLLVQSGRYHIVATLHLKDWNAQVASAPKVFEVVNGVVLWSQEFGLPASTNAPGGLPTMRKYSLIKVNYQNSQLRLYVQVSDPANARVYQVKAVGPLVSFSKPEAQVDQASRLHVLCQTGGTLFGYSVIDPEGTIVSRQLYDYVGSRPRLGVDEQGAVKIIGGVRRLPADEMPMVKMPDEVRIPAKP